MDTYRELCELTLIFKEDPLFVVEVKRDLIPRATGGPREFNLNCYTKLQYFSGVPIKCPWESMVLEFLRLQVTR